MIHINVVLVITVPDPRTPHNTKVLLMDNSLPYRKVGEEESEETVFECAATLFEDLSKIEVKRDGVGWVFLEQCKLRDNDLGSITVPYCCVLPETFDPVLPGAHWETVGEIYSNARYYGREMLADVLRRV
jgi:hypothetical protein